MRDLRDKETGEADVAWGHQPVATTQLRWVRQWVWGVKSAPWSGARSPGTAHRR